MGTTFKRLLAIVAAMALLTACTTQKSFEASLSDWVGKSETELLVSKGSPNAIEKRNGTKYLSWTRTRPNQATIYTPMWLGKHMIMMPGPTITNGPDFHCTETFTLRNEKITGWKWSGDDCFTSLGKDEEEDSG